MPGSTIHRMKGNRGVDPAFTVSNKDDMTRTCLFEQSSVL